MSEYKYEIEGTLTVIGEVQEFKGGFKKRQFVIKTPGEYSQDVALELVKDGVSKIDKFRLGDGVKVSFNVRGNEYGGKYYVQLSAWKIVEANEHSVGARSPEYGQPERRSANQNGARPPQQVDDDTEESIPF